MLSEKTLRFVGWLGIAAIGVLSTLPGDARPHLGTDIPGQAEHFLAYFTTSCVLALGYRKREHVAPIVLGLMAYASVLEVAQLWIPGRMSRLIDFVASASGVLAGMGVIEFMRIGLPLWRGTDRNRGCES
jgi:VanZ family protein